MKISEGLKMDFKTTETIKLIVLGLIVTGFGIMVMYFKFKGYF